MTTTDGILFDPKRMAALLEPHDVCDDPQCIVHGDPLKRRAWIFPAVRIGGRRVEEPNFSNNREAASTLKTGVVPLSGISDTPPLCFTNETKEYINSRGEGNPLEE